MHPITLYFVSVNVKSILDLIYILEKEFIHRLHLFLRNNLNLFVRLVYFQINQKKTRRDRIVDTDFSWSAIKKIYNYFYLCLRVDIWKHDIRRHHDQLLDVIKWLYVGCYSVMTIRIVVPTGSPPFSLKPQSTVNRLCSKEGRVQFFDMFSQYFRYFDILSDQTFRLLISVRKQEAVELLTKKSCIIWFYFRITSDHAKKKKSHGNFNSFISCKYIQLST